MHEVKENKTLKELCPPSGGAWGGNSVNEAYEKFLEELFTREVYEEFANTYRSDRMALQRQLETSKRRIGAESDGFITIYLPTFLLYLYDEKTKGDLTEALKNPQYGNNIRLARDKLRIRQSRLKEFFSSAIKNILEHLKKLFELPNVPWYGYHFDGRRLFWFTSSTKAITDAFPSVESSCHTRHN